MMIMALAEAALLKDGEVYAAAALKCGNFLWEVNRQNDRQLWRASFHGQSSVPAVQEDYAWLADAYISLYDLSREPLWLKRARGLLDRMHHQFRDETGGGYFMNSMTGDAALAMGRPKEIRDGAVPAGNAVALHALARLARRPGERGEFLEPNERALQLLASFGPVVNKAPSAYPSFLIAANILANGQSGPMQYAAHGGVAVRGQVTDRQLTVGLSIQPGWHINAHQPLSDNLIPTRLETLDSDNSWAISGLSYPPAILKSLEFQDEDLALYEGDISLRATLSPGTAPRENSLLRLTLQLQACDEKVCLPPERLQLQVPVSDATD